MSKLGLIRPNKGIVLAGRALRNIMGSVMLDLYESNIVAVPGAPEK